MNSTQKPLVAIRTIVYNHKSYLRDYFEGVVMQKTNFPFVAVVHDDCSTDGSTEIIKEYADKYPDIIKPIFEKENQWHKHDGSLARIMNEAIAATNAKYVAICEGDDYWTDPYKLQKQVDFLETHPDFGCCCTRYRYYYQNRNEFSELDHFGDIFVDGQEGVEINHDNYFEIGKLPQILTTMHRRELIPPDAYYYKLKNRQDDALFYCMTLYGKIWLMNEVTGVYRKRDNSATWTIDQGGAIAQTKMLHDIWTDCRQYDKSEELRGTVLWSIEQYCTSTIRYAGRVDWKVIKQCLNEHKAIASAQERRFFYKRILRAFVVRFVKRPYRK